MPEYKRDAGRKRLYAFQEDDDDLDFADRLSKSTRSGRRSEKDQAVVSFGGNGAEGKHRSPSPEGPKVIPMIANVDWREDRKRRLGLHDRAKELGSLSSIRAGSAAQPTPNDTKQQNEPDRINDEEQKVGLQVMRERPTTAQANEPMRDVTPPAAEARAETPPPETAEQAAIRALLAGDAVGSSSANRPDLVIPQHDEKEVLQTDVETRPEAPSLADYAATPVDQYGAALLRGMGWKEGMGAGRNGKGPQTAAEPKKRAALLGLGAKERALEPLPGSSKDRKGPVRPERRYVPVTKDSTPLSRDGSQEGKSRSRYEDDPSRGHGSRRRSPDGGSSTKHDSSRSSRHRSDERSERRRDDGRERNRRDRDDRRRDEHHHRRERDRSPGRRPRPYDE